MDSVDDAVPAADAYHGLAAWSMPEDIALLQIWTLSERRTSFVRNGSVVEEPVGNRGDGISHIGSSRAVLSRGFPVLLVPTPLMVFSCCPWLHLAASCGGWFVLRLFAASLVQPVSSFVDVGTTGTTGTTARRIGVLLDGHPSLT